MPLLLGLVLVAVVVLLLKWYAEADVKTLKSSLRWTGLTLGLLVVAGLAVTGRLPVALAGLAALGTWAWRVFNVVQTIRNFRHQSAPRQDPPKQRSAQMDEAEAWRVLGLEAGASPEEIKAAHRRLMAQLHPDRGGSDYLAGKVNAARDVLLAKKR